MNEQTSDAPISIEDLLGEAPARDPKDDQIAALESKVQELLDKRDEDRFIGVLVAVALFDCFVFSRMDNWAGPVVIGIIQLFGLVILADRLHVDTVAPLIDKLVGGIVARIRTPE